MKKRRTITLFLLVFAIMLTSAVGVLADTGEAENGYKSGDVKFLIIGAVSSFVCVCAIDLIARVISKKKKKPGDDNGKK